MRCVVKESQRSRARERGGQGKSIYTTEGVRGVLNGKGVSKGVSRVSKGL